MARPELHLPSYPVLAELLRVRLCDRSCQMETLQAHTMGWSDYRYIHWKPRITTRRGIWNFLKLVADQRHGLFDRREIERLWLRNSEAYDLGLELGYRFPREFADLERAQVRAILARDSRMALDKETRTMIERWARP